MTGEQLIVAARALVGTPFLHAGRNEHGVDCPGLILLPAWELGLTDFQPRNYSAGSGHAYLLEILDQECERIDGPHGLSIYRDPRHPATQPGDIALFAIDGQPQHLAYLTKAEPPTFIHARERRGVKESRLDEEWQSRLLSVWRWKALAVPTVDNSGLFGATPGTRASEVVPAKPIANSSEERAC